MKRTADFANRFRYINCNKLEVFTECKEDVSKLVCTP